jgi:hypothetical protein
VPNRKWRVVVAKLGASSVLHEGDVEANNWMSALRAARQAMSERPSVPPGASCSIDADGVATVLDPGSRRKFVLSPLDTAVGSAAPKSAPEPEPPAAVAPAPAQGKKKKFQTVALIPDELPASAPLPVTGPTGSAAQNHSASMAAVPPTSGPSDKEPSGAQPPTPEPAQPSESQRPGRKKKRFETVGFAAEFSAPAAAPPVASTPPASGPDAEARRDSTPSQTSQRPRPELELLLGRDDAPSEDNPLSYVERAYLLPKGCTVPDAEAELRWKLAELQKALASRPRGQFINLAVFDHQWNDVPERPPVIVLQWRDWRGEVVADYPAATRFSSMPPPSRPNEDRLAEVFEALEALPRMPTAADGLDFAVRLLERTVPAEAISACLYDINTDELRFVALSGARAA